MKIYCYENYINIRNSIAGFGTIFLEGVDLMFPAEITIRKKTFQIIDNHLTKNELKALFINNPYGVYAIVNESMEKEEPMLTTFLVLYSVDFEENVILYDISRQIHTTITTELFFLEKGYIEFIDVGMVDRYPIKFYKKEEIYENI
jgi:hypothetical protein